MQENNPNMMPQPKENQPLNKPSRPNESGRLEIMDHVRIYDPNTKQVQVEKRS